MGFVDVFYIFISFFFSCWWLILCSSLAYPKLLGTQRICCCCSETKNQYSSFLYCLPSLLEVGTSKVPFFFNVKHCSTSQKNNSVTTLHPCFSELLFHRGWCCSHLCVDHSFESPCRCSLYFFLSFLEALKPCWFKFSQMIQKDNQDWCFNLEFYHTI